MVMKVTLLYYKKDIVTIW